MKKVSVLSALVVTTVFCISASSLLAQDRYAIAAIPKKMQQHFQQDFPDAKEEVFQTGDIACSFYFKRPDSSSCRVYYDLDGNMTKKIEYYKSAQLSMFIRARLNEKYANKTIFGVTETTSTRGHIYEIVLQDQKKWYYVNCNDSGEIDIQKELTKQ